jgi:hypothetical protein
MHLNISRSWRAEIRVRMGAGTTAGREEKQAQREDRQREKREMLEKQQVKKQQQQQPQESQQPHESQEQRGAASESSSSSGSGSGTPTGIRPRLVDTQGLQVLVEVEGGLNLAAVRAVDAFEKRPSFLKLSYVCPEPALVK